MARRPRIPVLLAFATLFAVAGEVTAQGTLDVVLATPTITFAAPGTADFDAGWIEHGGVSVALSSRPGNRAWELRIRATSPTLGPGKPVSDLEWRAEGSSVWTPMSQTGDAVLQGTGDQDITLHFRMLLSWANDAPGTYSTGLELTIVRI